MSIVILYFDIPGPCDWCFQPSPFQSSIPVEEPGHEVSLLYRHDSSSELNQMHRHKMMSVLASTHPLSISQRSKVSKMSSKDSSSFSTSAGSHLLFGGLLLPSPSSSVQTDEALRILWKSFQHIPFNFLIFFDNLVRRSVFQQRWTLLL